MGGLGTGEAFQNNFLALKRYRLNLRTIHDVSEPRLSIRLFGREFPFPVLAAAIAGAKLNFRGILTEHELAGAMVLGARQAGTVALTGDGPDPVLFEAGLAAAREAGGAAIPVIKPRRQEEIIRLLRLAEEAGALAAGIDIDAAGLVNMTRAGQAVAPKTGAELAELVRATRLPLILKGIMTAADAVAAAEAGVAAIVVSNHGGRALDHTPGTAEVLSEIAAAVGGRTAVLVDGGIRSGADILKCLALGADAVLVGRPLAIAAVGGGADGVALALEELRKELYAAMILTGTADVTAVSRNILR